MKSRLLAATAVLVLGLSASPARAFFCCDHQTLAVILNWPGYNVFPPGTTFQKQVVTGYYPHWYQQQVPTVVPRTTFKLETTPVKTYVNMPKVVEETQSYLTYVPKSRLVAKDVSTCVMVPLILVGPGGMPIITCRPEIRTHRVSYAVQDLEPVMKQTTVKVTRMVPVPQITQYQQVVPIVSYDQIMTTQWQCMWVPYQRVVNVPVFDPTCPPSLFWP